MSPLASFAFARPALRAAAVLALTAVAFAQETPEQRLDRIEAENAELRRRVDLVAGDFERFSLGGLIPELGESVSGLGPAASKVYAAEQGVSLGGYGEMLYENFDSTKDDGSASGKTDQADLLRAVLYFGYKFDDTWVFNSEIEYEHTDEVGVEFAYLDGRFCECANLRAGLVLLPMGLTNELHEPTSFPSARRPGIESAILPTTWRENGVGMYGDIGDFAYRTYVVNGFDADGFTASGLRGGRQNGGKAEADDLAWVGRVDWVGAPGVMLGGSAYVGNAGQSHSFDVGTSIYEAHVDAQWRGARLRALYAMAELDDVTELDNALGLTGAASVGEELGGYYVELGYDVMSLLRPGSVQSLTPFVRWETYDTQAEVPAGFASDPANEVEIVTVGIAYQPIDNIVFKLDYMDIDNDADTGVDQFNVALGYIF